MKKLFLFLIICSLSLTMSAEVQGVYYLLPNSYGWKGSEVTNVYDNERISIENPTLDISSSDQNNQLKWEKPWGDREDYSPERRAYEWFKDSYQGGTQKVLTYEDLKVGIPADVKVIWVNMDRNMSEAEFNSLFPNDVVSALSTFVENGGNLFLSTFATCLVEKMGRVNSGHPINVKSWNNGWNGDGADWGVRIVNQKESSAVYFKMGETREWRDNAWYKYQLITGAHTDRNCLWGDWHVVDEGAQLLGCWSNGGNEAGFGFVEFFPGTHNEKTWKGTIITMGLAAYQWGFPAGNESANGKLGNVKNLTIGILDYLRNTPNGKDDGQTGTKMSDIFLGDWCYPASLATENHSFRTIHPIVSGWTTNNWIAGDQTNVADIMYINDADKLVFKQEGTVTLHTTITEDRELQAWPKGTYEYTHDVTFTYSSSAQAVADADLSSNGLDGETGKFMVLHKNMRGMDATYTTNFDGIEAANRAEVEIIEDGEFNRLKFTKAGTVKLNIRLNEPNFREEWAKGEHNIVKTVTFAQPAFTWTHQPDHAAITEVKDPAQATCSVPGATVKYESDNAEIASIDENTGKITYNKAGTCNIYAFIEINGVKFRSNPFALTVNAPTFQWTSCPGTMKNGEKATFVAEVLYIDAAEVFELSGAAAEINGTNITAKEEGTITITPKATINGHTYTFESRHITVVAPTLAWATEPNEAAILEDATKPAAQATCDVEGFTVKYRSANSDIIAIDELTGVMNYKAEATEGINITAYIDVYGHEYAISHNTRVFTPKADWVTRPATEAHVGDVISIKAKVRYGAATLGYTFDSEYIEYTPATETEDAKIRLIKAGSTTIRPHAVAYGQTYFNDENVKPEEKGEAIAITVTYAQERPRAHEDLHLDEAQCYPDNTDHWLRLHPVMEGLTASYEIQATEADVKGEAINWEHTDNAETVHDLVWTKSGAINLHITLVESRTDQKWPAGSYEYDRVVTFNFAKTEPVHGWPEALNSNVKINSEVVLYNETEGYPVTYSFTPAEGVSEYNDETHTITFRQSGSVTITATVEVEDYNTNFPKGTYTYDKTVIVDAPELTWHEGSFPHDGTLMESKPSIRALVDGESDDRVHYRSLAPEYIDIDENNFLIYKKPTTGEGVAIEAYIIINDKEYKLTQMTKAVAPVVTWTTAPAANAFVGDEMTILAEVNHGSAPVLYDVTGGCSYAGGKLTFSAEGTATVRPYALACGEKYYGEQKTISVTVKPTDTVYVRHTAAGNYGTICLERNSTKLEGATFYWPAYKNNAEGEVDFIVLEEVKTLTAGQGYFFWATSSEVKVTMSLADEVLSAPLQHDPANGGPNTRGMHGNFGPENLTVPNYTEGLPNEYVLTAAGKLVYGTGNWIGEHRAYLKMSEVPTEDEYKAMAVPGRRQIRMTVQNPGTATELEMLNASTDAVKFVQNGKLYILRAGRLYSADGRLVK